MRRVGDGVNRVSLIAKSDPARAPDEFLCPKADALATVPGHYFGDLGCDFGRRFRRQFFFAQMVLSKKTAVIEKHEQFWFALNDNGEIRVRNQ